ncbi:MAG TPA: hypothetical protein PLL72_16225 [Burkholderiaceae bacterium]|nr:hypothetical protein [Burkholderiaceae bacterium]
MNLTDIAPHWVALHDALGLGAPIVDEAQYAHLLALVDELFDSTAADPAHPLGGLVALLAERIGEYERRVHPWPDEADLLDRRVVTIAAKDWARFEAWAGEPAKEVPALRQLAEARPVWQSPQPGE